MLFSFLQRPLPLIRWVLIIIVIMSIGVGGFMLIEGFRFLDALYMAVITISTIGYQEVHPLSDAGRIFNIFLIIASFSTFTYALARLTQYIASGELGHDFKKRSIMQALDRMHHHVIICGFGRNGQQAAKTLRAHKIPFVVIEKHSIHLEAWLQDDPHLVYLTGDATEDDTLQRAHIDTARALLITLPQDADNVFIVLSARSLNPKLQIISRASHQSATAKLYKAGADNVIMPDMIGGTHMATLVTKPDVLEFIDFLSGEDGQSIFIESISYEQLPRIVRGRTLSEVMAWNKTGVNCIGIKDESGKFFINPPEGTLISPGMRVILLGTKDQITAMKKNVGEAGS